MRGTVYKKILIVCCLAVIAPGMPVTSQARRATPAPRSLSGCYPDLKLVGKEGYVVGAVAEDARQQPCLRYESVVRLRGTIRRESFPGRPNYESVRRGDEPETVWLLQLARPLCVGGGEVDEAETNVREVQLVLTPVQYRRWRTLVGARAVAAGRLFHSSTGHHHTRVLLNVSELEKASRRRPRPSGRRKSERKG